MQQKCIYSNKQEDNQAYNMHTCITDSDGAIISYIAIYILACDWLNYLNIWLCHTVTLYSCACTGVHTRLISRQYAHALRNTKRIPSPFYQLTPRLIRSASTHLSN